MRIIDNVQPARQTVMFSATFPRQVEALAKKILTKPLEIMVSLLKLFKDERFGVGVFVGCVWFLRTIHLSNHRVLVIAMSSVGGLVGY